MNEKSTLPKFFKDKDGFCYTATDLLALLPDLEAYDGDIDERGFAVASDKPARKSKAPKTVEPVEPDEPVHDEPKAE